MLTIEVKIVLQSDTIQFKSNIKNKAKKSMIHKMWLDENEPTNRKNHPRKEI